MRIAVFGLGYVGCVSAACFAELGHEVVGVDVNVDKVALVNRGKPTIVEERIGAIVESAVSAGRLRATTSAPDAVASTDLALVCVGTPSATNGSLSTEYVDRVATEIGACLTTADDYYVVALRSSMLPGTCESRVIPRLEAGGGRAGRDFGVVVNPEFLREGSSVRDFFDPPKTVVGQLTDRCGDAVAALYDEMTAPFFRVPLRVAEMIKYVDNAFHALKVTFANEIGAICKAHGLDSHDVMEVFKADTKLNISPAYLTPGFAFGGSCLPKDLRALLHFSRRSDVQTPVLEQILRSNEEQIQRVYDFVVARGRRRVGMLGLAFKEGTDDLRESPMVELAERLLGRGFDLRIHDANVLLSRLAGANRAYVETRIPHLSRLMLPDAGSVVEHGDTCVLATSAAEVLTPLRAASGKIVVDLVRVPDADAIARENDYWGVGW